jgi:hypothetical protein
MSSCGWLSPARRAAFVVTAVLAATGTANAQLAPASKSSHQSAISSAESSSDDYLALTGSSSPDPALPAAPAAGGAAAGQYDNKSGASGGRFSHLAFEAGGGFNGPIGNDSQYITWGGNFTVGGGLHFSQAFSVLGEFQFIDDKLPGAFVASGGGQGGNAHIISLTVDPVFDLFPKKTNSLYVTGGGGFYHKSTNFTVQQCCDFYGYPVNVTANSFTSNQAGVNLGMGYSRRLGGMYGDGKMKLFAEARYTWINTPPITETNGLGRTELIPVTFGMRW